MRQGNRHRPLAKAVTYAILKPSGTKKTRDGQLPDEDQHFGSDQLQLGIEPVRAVGYSGRRRLQVTAARAVAPREAAHQRCDVGEAPELLGAFKTGADHPPVELFPSAAGKGSPRYPLDRAGSLAD